jgi:hypothetical protein
MKKKPTNKNTFTPLWQTGADGYTPQSAAQEFVRTYWDKPRNLIWLGNNTFQVEDGVRTYRVVYRERTAELPALYLIGPTQ